MPFLQKIFHVIAEVPAFCTKQTNKIFPSAKISGEITPEYLGVGYIIGPKIAGVLVAGGVLSWFVFTPLLATLNDDGTDLIASQLVKLGYLKDLNTAAVLADGILQHMYLLIGPLLFTVLIYDRSVQVQ